MGRYGGGSTFSIAPSFFAQSSNSIQSSSTTWLHRTDLDGRTVDDYSINTQALQRYRDAFALFVA